MRDVIDTFAALVMLALSACAFVALDIAMRPDHYVRAAAQSRVSVPLESLSRRLLPGLKKASAYRIVGLASAMLVLGLAMLIFAYEFSYYSTR